MAKLSVVLPAYNEEAMLLKAAETLKEILEKEKIEYANQKTKEMAAKMLEEGIDIIKIMKITGLTEEDLLQLQKDETITV